MSSRASNVTFDVGTTILSALSTAFTPIATVHALSAAATITSGTKTAVDADIYQTATAPLMVEAIQQTYNIKMDALLVKVEAMPETMPAPADGEKPSDGINTTESCAASQTARYLRLRRRHHV